MKTFFLSLLFLTGFSIAASAQDVSVPGTMNYQAVARDASGKALPNKTIKVRLSIWIDGGAGMDYSETRSVTTNALGLFSIVIGDQKALEQNGYLQNVHWNASPALRVEIDINNGTNFVKMGEQLLTTSPFAFHADKAHWAEEVAPRNMYNFLYKSTAAQYVSKSSLTTVSFETKQQNSGITYNTTTHEITIPKTGLYYLHTSVGIVNSGGLAQVFVHFFKNGSSFYDSQHEIAASASSTKTISTVYQLNAGDKIKVSMYYQSGTATTLRVGDTGNSSYFGGYLIQ